ncbi:MAG: TIGR04283 family arsenosugar biosynthesis glycosyltransferase [Bacteroidota bacterium]
MISIIIPTYNEESCIETALQSVLRHSNEATIEVLVSDGNSEDRTVEIATKYAEVISGTRGRAKQLNRAAHFARGDTLFFLHADAILPKGALRQIDQKVKVEGYDGGGFSNTFSSHNTKIKFLGRLMNFRIRDNDHTGNTVFFGDNGIFVRKSVFQALNGFRDMPIMEDYDFSTRMKRAHRVTRILEPQLLVSPRRHLKAGFLKTRLQWIVIKRLHQAGVPTELLSQWYINVR